MTHKNYPLAIFRMLRVSVFIHLIDVIICTIGNFLSKRKLVYIVENSNWAVKDVGLSIVNNVKISASIAITYYGVRRSIVHYGSINTFIHATKGLRLPHKSNYIVVTWFHIAFNEPRIKYISEAVKYVDLWHTSCTLTQKKLINLGIPSSKIIKIPIGVKLDAFSPAEEKRLLTRKDFSIPKGSVVIGSYQKDGNGWGRGLTPKYVKGPDIFCDTIEALAKQRDIFVLLTGPARGYVKKRLKGAGIPFRHDFLDNSDDVALYYKVTDVYLITSREEGGPKQILESMASGVPVISTCVGMAPDIILNERNGIIVDLREVKGLAQKVEKVLDNKDLRERMINGGLKTAQQYDCGIIAQRYEKCIYQVLQ
jgi:glycosyltransferase involved in cell wall biosynthesis